MNGTARAPRRILILGATSAMAEQAARLWAEDGARLVLVGRAPEKLAAIAADVTARGAKQATTLAADLARDPVAPVLAQAVQSLGGIDVALLAYGVLGSDDIAGAPSEVDALFNINFVSAAHWCLALARELEHQGYGALVVLGSVAGDRGRQSNYIYGATKAGLGVLVQGIAHRLARVGARAVLVKPGLTDTPMTAHMRKGPLWSRPDAVARVIVAAAERRDPIVYAPGWWRWVMLMIRMVPSAVMHRTKL